MQVGIQGIWFVVCAIIALIVVLKVSKFASKVIILAVLVGVLFAGSKVIDLHTIAPAVMEKVSEVSDMVGENLIKTEGNSVLVKMGDKWYDVSKISIIGDLATDDIVFEYDGEQIFIGNSGIVNVLKVLDSVGLVEVRDEK